uniref:Aquaporin n=1 Tax=Amphora coffeiformis TaxID=265554 RepID=A0A7S3LB05_9STRA
MVKTIIQNFGDSLNSFFEFLPPGLVLSLLTAYIGQGRYVQAFRQEFVGTLLMVMCTFSAGKWVGKASMYQAWGAHALGVISADYIGGGPQVNPAVTVGMWSLGKVTYTEGFVRIAAQLGGGLIAFPLFHAVAEAYDLEPFGGPEFDIGDKNAAIEAFLSEFCATALLMWAIFLLNWEFHFGKYHYIIKQSLTAVAIRALIEFFPTAGPAMNPMLATSWAVFGVGEKFNYPDDFMHYFVYWISPCMASVFACALYVIYNGGTLFGQTLPIGPLKPKKSIKKAKKN